MHRLKCLCKIGAFNYCYGKMGNFYHFDLHLSPGVSQKGSKFVICQLWMEVSNFFCERSFLCKFAALVFYFYGDGYFCPYWA